MEQRLRYNRPGLTPAHCGCCNVPASSVLTQRMGVSGVFPVVSHAMAEQSAERECPRKWRAEAGGWEGGVAR